MLSENEYQQIQLQLKQIPTIAQNKQQANLRKRLRKQIKEHECAINYIPFEPLPHILYFINRTTTEECLHHLIQAATVSSEFTIDTESINIYKQKNEPVLIQLQILLPNNSSFVLLIEMYHLPNEKHICFTLIQKLFKIIFSKNKQVYIWGPKAELYPFVVYKLFSRERIDFLRMINLQNQFKLFWQQQHPHKLSNSSSLNTSATNCDCENCLGIGSLELWSLQNSVKFELNEYLSKQFSTEDFHIGLDPTLFSLNLNEKRYRQQLTNYASNDCLSMQRLIIHMKNKNFRFYSDSTTNSQYDLSELSSVSSDDDDARNTFSSTKTNVSPTNTNQVITTNKPYEVQQQLTKEERKRIHNKSCTKKQRKRYYKHELIYRGIDNRFSITSIKNILRKNSINFCAINKATSSFTRRTSLYIGIKHPEDVPIYKNKTKNWFTSDHDNTLYRNKHRTNSNNRRIYHDHKQYKQH